ncbi:MAG: hypothetical protein QOJ78_599 [Pseudonocardiales bacterium]|nr:hypothetical protein [Pseudonocardiales bacterium]
MMADGRFSTDAVAVIDTCRRTGRLVLSRPTGQLSRSGYSSMPAGQLTPVPVAAS